MITQTIDFFDLRSICSSGQIFRMYEREDGIFDVYSGSRHLRLRQRSKTDNAPFSGSAAEGASKDPIGIGRKNGLFEPVTVDFYCSGEDFNGYWRRYFDLDRDYGAIVQAGLGGESCLGVRARLDGAGISDVQPGNLDKINSDSQTVFVGKSDSDSGTVYERESNSDTRTGNGFVAAACRYGAGIRILHQDIWEMLISFIISQQKQIPSIRKCIEALCERFGEKQSEILDTDGIKDCVDGKEDCLDSKNCVDGRDCLDGKDHVDSKDCLERKEDAPEHCWYSFPTAQAIAAAGPEGLKGLSLGYRERYIYETAVRYLSEGLPYTEVEQMGLEEASKYFRSFCGVGEKVANCICLFGAGYVDAFPIDTHIKDILYREFYLMDVNAENGKPVNKEDKTAAEGPTNPGGANNMKDSRDHGLTMADYEELVRMHFDRFRGYRGIVQQWIFAWELVRKYFTEV